MVIFLITPRLFEMLLHFKSVKNLCLAMNNIIEYRAIIDELILSNGITTCIINYPV